MACVACCAPSTNTVTRRSVVTTASATTMVAWVEVLNTLLPAAGATRLMLGEVGSASKT